jgi:hypothetical protein
MARSSEELAAFRDAGVDIPILFPPVGGEAALMVIRAFHR